MDCVNLRERFGQRYRVTHEESYLAERPEYRREEEPWLQIIPCQRGHICPWGGTKLAACTDRPGRTAQRLREMSGVQIAQDGSDGANAVFDVAAFEAVAEIMKPRKRRVLTEEQRRRRAETLAPFRFLPASQRSPESQSEPPAPILTQNTNQAE